ncbi:MAG TPA: hypothetical protein VFP50_03165 [Anaeromyxobacteraceae bacterium]|nr:hypothetical protein [Anaeromyxobacteraceae bacterium]
MTFAAVAAALLAAVPAPAASAGEPPPGLEPAAPPAEPSPLAGLHFAAGFAAGFAAHEGCHLLANEALGNQPRLEPVTFAGAVPFFAISPGIACSGDRCLRRDGAPFGPGRAGLWTIVSAGLQCQHLEDEVLLTTTPRLRAEEAPFRTGLLAFNTLTSVAYVAANWLGTEPPEGDLRTAYRETGAPRHLVNSLVLGAAALDVARWLFPDSGWLAWASRAVKVGAGGVVLTL